MSYIFGGNTGISYADLVKARQQQEMYRRQQEAARDSIGAPTTFGGGLNAVGSAIASIISGRKADKIGKEADAQEQQLRSGYRSALGELLGGSLGGGGRNLQPAPVTRNQAMAANGGPTNAAAAAWDGKSRGNPYRDAIASIESAGSGDYSAVGPTNPRLGRALGRYQIMEANIGPWSREALGREVTPDEFLNSPEIQDAIFDHKFNGYVEQFGPEGAAQAWFAGPGGIGKMDRKDVLGTSVADYTQKFKNALGGETMSARQPQGGQNLPPNNQVAGGGSLPQILELINSPFASEQDKQVLGMMAERIMNPPKPSPRDTQYIDGVGLIDKQTGQVIQNYPGAQGQGGTEYGLTPQFGVDENGNPVMLQVGKDGTAVQTQMPDDVSLSREPIRLDAGTHFVLLDPVTRQPVSTIPKDNRGAASETAAGRIEGEAAAQSALDAPGTVMQADETIRLIDQVLADPALPDVVGKVQGRIDPDSWAGMFMSQEALNLMPKIQQLQGKAFLQAFEGLKGGGQITEREGQAATAAITRLNQRYVDDDTYKEALNDLRRIADNAKRRARGENVDEYVPSWFGENETTQGSAVSDFNDTPAGPNGTLSDEQLLRKYGYN